MSSAGRTISEEFARERPRPRWRLFCNRAVVPDNPSPLRERSVLILDAAGVLGVSRRTVYYWIRDGRLQTVRTRGGSQRVLWSSIEALLRSMRPALAAPIEPDAPHEAAEP